MLSLAEALLRAEEPRARRQAAEVLAQVQAQELEQQGAELEVGGQDGGGEEEELQLQALRPEPEAGQLPSTEALREEPEEEAEWPSLPLLQARRSAVGWSAELQAQPGEEV